MPFTHSRSREYWFPASLKRCDTRHTTNEHNTHTHTRFANSKSGVRGNLILAHQSQRDSGSDDDAASRKTKGPPVAKSHTQTLSSRFHCPSRARALNACYAECARGFLIMPKWEAEWPAAAQRTIIPSRDTPLSRAPRAIRVRGRLWIGSLAADSHRWKLACEGRQPTHFGTNPQKPTHCTYARRKTELPNVGEI